eukprot:6194259-Pleurochrysis_carterae.AAC.2
MGRAKAGSTWNFAFAVDPPRREARGGMCTVDLVASSELERSLCCNVPEEDGCALTLSKIATKVAAWAHFLQLKAAAAIPDCSPNATAMEKWKARTAGCRLSLDTRRPSNFRSSALKINASQLWAQERCNAHKAANFGECGGSTFLLSASLSSVARLG